jgi:hypothetical protein
VSVGLCDQTSRIKKSFAKYIVKSVAVWLVSQFSRNPRTGYEIELAVGQTIPNLKIFFFLFLLKGLQLASVARSEILVPRRRDKTKKKFQSFISLLNFERIIF